MRFLDKLFGKTPPAEPAEAVDRAYLDDLVKRMSSNEAAASGETLSQIAHREADKLKQPGLVPVLTDMLRSASRQQRGNIYFIAARNSFNTGSDEGLKLLINCAAADQDRQSAVAALDQIAHLRGAPGIDTSPLRMLVSDTRPGVRHAAIMALGCSYSPESEDKLLDVLAQSQDPFDLIYANAALGRIGTQRALPALEANLQSRKRDVKTSAAYAIDRIKERL